MQPTDALTEKVPEFTKHFNSSGEETSKCEKVSSGFCSIDNETLNESQAQNPAMFHER